METGSKPSLWKTMLLALWLLSCMIFLYFALSIVVGLLAGNEHLTFRFGNQFFIQCLVFTAILAGAAAMTRPMGFKVTGIHSLFALRSAGMVEITICVLASIAITFPLNHLDSLLQAFLPPSEAEKNLMIAAYHPPTAVEKVFVVLSIMAAAPVGEELLFRGAMMSWIKDSSKWWVALPATALLFGAAHLASVPRWVIPIIPVGLMLGWFVIRTGSIFTSIAGHAAFNGFPVFAYWSGFRIEGYNIPAESHARMHPLLWTLGSVAVILLLYLLETVVKTRRTGSDD